jgi:L-seryl-tRNA(Ser) seleniumtransferase
LWLQTHHTDLYKLWLANFAQLDERRVEIQHALFRRLLGHLRVVDLDATVGGGSVPGAAIPSVGLACDVDDASAGLAVLREHSVVARVHDGAIVCDLRTVDPRDDPHLAKALLAIAP